jgi:hypothetical protein
VSQPELEVHPDDLAQIADILDSAGSALFPHASELHDTPDAGSSTDEVASALTVLSTAVAGLADHLGALAESTGSVSGLFTGTDQHVGGRLDSGREVLGP